MTKLNNLERITLQQLDNFFTSHPEEVSTINVNSSLVRTHAPHLLRAGTPPEEVIVNGIFDDTKALLKHEVVRSVTDALGKKIATPEFKQNLETLSRFNKGEASAEEALKAYKAVRNDIAKPVLTASYAYAIRTELNKRNIPGAFVIASIAAGPLASLTIEGAGQFTKLRNAVYTKVMKVLGMSDEKIAESLRNAEMVPVKMVAMFADGILEQVNKDKGSFADRAPQPGTHMRPTAPNPTAIG